MVYEKLLEEAKRNNISTYEMPLSKRNKGFYADNVIWINKHLTTNDKICTLAEELGHYHTSVGDILDQSNLTNRKQERQARNWAYKKLIPLDKIIDAFHAGVQSSYELAKYLNVTEEFLLETLNSYKDKYGVSKTINQYTIFFEPLTIMEIYTD